MLGWLLLGGSVAALFQKHRNPHWTPFSTLFATPRELNAALERVRITSVPTPATTSALDPGMSSEHVKAVNVVLTSETDPSKIKSEAKSAKALGFHNTSKALEAKASAVGHAKAKGATDDDIQKEHLAAQTSQGASAAATHAAGWDGYGIDRHRSYERRGYGDVGQQWPHHHHRHHQQEELGDLGGDEEEIDPRILWWLMQQQQQQQHPHHHHHHRRHHHHEYGGDFETRGPVAHPHPFVVPQHHGHGGGGGGGGGQHFGHHGHHHGFGYGGFGYPGWEIDPYLYYPPMMDMGDDMMFDDSMMFDDGGF